MPLPLIPAEFNLTATSEDDVDENAGMALFQGQSYVLSCQVLDADGDPFDLGPTNDPDWTFAASLRGDFKDWDSSVDAAFTISVTDGPNGFIELTLAPTLTAALSADEGRWDLFITNVSNADYDVGFSQMVLRGTWKLERRVTAA